MEIIDIICWTIIGAVVSLVIFFFVWALCVVAGKSDEISEECWQEYIRSKEEEENE